VLRPGGDEISPDVIGACRRGDREAIRVLYDVYREKVYSIAFYYFEGDAAAAADVTQQVFLKVIRGVGGYRGEAAFSTWLYRLVLNACADTVRRRKSDARLTDVAVLTGVPDPSARFEDGLVRDETARAVREAVSSLPPKLRFAVLLRYFDDLSYADMAAALGCSIGTVSSRLSRAHRMLAAKLAALRRPSTAEPAIRG
jgi:RNA polymerase sigma-70 factor (ECF subfamily)